jgi:VIT1/CCC1 family predicted Fe2+/Mn2+ transporter
MHRELHKGERIGWLRAAVLGANDGLISTSSLVVGVAAAEPSRAAVLLAAVAGLVAGALSMAAGEYVSVSSQKDTEQARISNARRASSPPRRRRSAPSWRGSTPRAASSRTSPPRSPIS